MQASGLGRISSAQRQACSTSKLSAKAGRRPLSVQSISIPRRALPRISPVEAVVLAASTSIASERSSNTASTSDNSSKSLWDKYSQSVEDNPVPTKALTSLFGFTIGDILAQTIGGESFDVMRCLRLGGYGLLLDGPIGHWWYKILDKAVLPNDSKSTAAVLIKTAADQLIWAPIMTAVFFAFLKLAEGQPEAVVPCIQGMLIKTLVANYVVWPLAHFANFRFVPTQHRILYNNVVAIAWNCYLSTMCHACPALDTEQLLGVIHSAQDLLDQMSVVYQDPYTAAFTQAANALNHALVHGAF